MKLTKKRLIKTITPLLEAMGYINIPSINWEGLFGKKSSEQIYITIGFTISNLYEDSFTAVFYISTNTCCGAEWKGIPHGCRKGIRELIKVDDMMKLGFISNNDAEYDWFSVYDSNSINLFYRVLPHCEDVFLSNKTISDLMIQSPEVTRMTEEDKTIISIYISKEYVDKYDYQYVTLACGIEQEWYNAAEYYCRKYLKINKITPSVIRGYGQTAYQMYLLDKTFDSKFE